MQNPSQPVDQALSDPAASQTVESPQLQVSVVIPCLDEAASIEVCVTEARKAIQAGGYAGEVIVVDNASTDGSAELAARAGAHVVHEARRGYGNAYLAGLAAARGEYIVMIDADLTYDVHELPRFVEELERGGDLVLGDRIDRKSVV